MQQISLLLHASFPVVAASSSQQGVGLWQTATSRASWKTLVSLVIWCWVAAEVDMQCPALGMKGECFSGAFSLMQKQFLETVFLCYSTPSPRTCFQVFLLTFSNCSTAPAGFGRHWFRVQVSQLCYRCYSEQFDLQVLNCL